MSYRVPRRALVPAAVGVALAVGPVSLLAGIAPAAVAVDSPTQADVVLADPADAIALDDGRLLVNSGTGATRSIGVSTVTDPVPGQITVTTGAGSYAGTPVNTPDRHTFATSGGVDLVASSATGRVVARRGATTLLDVAAPSGSAWTVDLSGPYARIGRVVFDLRTPSSAKYTLPATTVNAAAYGSSFVWSESDGSVRYRDVAKTAAPKLIRSGTTGCTTCAVQVAINGTTVAYGLAGGSLSLWDSGTATGHKNALSLATAERFRLGDGFLVTTHASTVVLYRLNDPLTLSTPTPYLAGLHVVDLAVDGHAFAYLRANGSVTVAQLPDAVDGERRPILFTSSVPGAFSPNGDGVRDAWTPSFSFTQPVTDWSLQILDPSTLSPVATVTPTVGSLPASTVSVDWKATAALKQASYKWTLTATNADGSALTAAGGAITGTVNLRRKNERTTAVSTPLDVATATRSLRTPVYWRAAGAFPAGVTASTWDVQVRSVKIVRGKRVYGKAVGAILRTKKLSTTYPGKQGMTYQFRARSKDSVGLIGPWSGWKASSTPFDDRAKALRYSSGWSASRAVGPWGGTHHVTTKSGRQVRLSSSATSGFALVFKTCPTCGAVKVYVDGKLMKTVKLSGTAALRKEKYSVNFKKLGAHSIRIVTVANGAKKTVALDAVLVRH